MRKRLYASLLVLLVLSAAALIRSAGGGDFFSTVDQGDAGELVARVVDGDTYELAGGEKVRLVGIDTPELHESSKLRSDAERSGVTKNVIKILGKKAKQYARRLVEGRRVMLRRDSQTGDRDRYGRLLRYVFLEDGTSINLKMISDGYAHAYTRFPFDEMEEYRRAERDARENERGLWSDDAFRK